MFVLGIDPGLSRLGYGAVSRTAKSTELVAYGVLQTPPQDELPYRLASMNQQLRNLFTLHKPDVVVVERVFFQTNARTAMGVAQASGLALAAAIDQGSSVAQYTSNEVKLAITGFGAATKEQVQRMVQRMLRMEVMPKPADAADALALALHHLAVAPFLAAAVASERGIPANLRIASSVGATATDRMLGNARIATRAGGGVRVAGNAPRSETSK